MKTSPFVWLAWTALLSQAVVHGQKGTTPPVAIHQVEPEWGAIQNDSYVVEPVNVEMVIDSDGIPFSLTALASLPDNVVKALSQWKYRPGKKDGSNAPFSIVLILPVRRPINPGMERSIRRTWRPSYDLEKALKAGEATDAAGAARLEQDLEKDPHNENARATLLAYAAKEGVATNPDDVRKARVRHIAWLARNQPDAEILGNPLALINTVGGPLADPTGYEMVRQLWLNPLTADATNPAVFEHATNFLRISDPEKTEQMLLPVLNKIPGATAWLGDLYGLAALGVTGLDPKTGLPVSASERPDNAFVRRARSILSSATDARLVLSALNAVTTGGRALAKSGQLPAGYPAICEELLKRAKVLYPRTSISCDPSSSIAEDSDAPQRLRIGGNVQAAMLKKKVTPRYPDEAKSHRVQGTVKFLAVIGKDGKIQNLELMSSAFVFYEASYKAVLQWEYKPTLLNGQPVEVVTQIDVNYTMRQF